MISITVLELLNVWAIKTESKTENFFDNMAIDNRIDKKALFIEFIRIYGDDYPIYNDSIEFYEFVDNWFYCRNGFKELVDTLSIQYNPIHNYDRSESRNTNDKRNEINNNNATREDKISAFNSNTYQPNSTNIETINDSRETKRNENEIIKIQGNIGVTTSQQMIESEIKLRLNNVIIDMIVKELGKQFTMGVY